jgi:hypothetical protein
MLRTYSISRGLKMIPRCGFDQRNALALELEAEREIGGFQNAASQGSKAFHVAERRLS